MGGIFQGAVSCTALQDSFSCVYSQRAPPLHSRSTPIPGVWQAFSDQLSVWQESRPITTRARPWPRPPQGGMPASQQRNSDGPYAGRTPAILRPGGATTLGCVSSCGSALGALLIARCSPNGESRRSTRPSGVQTSVVQHLAPPSLHQPYWTLCMEAPPSLLNKQAKPQIAPLSVWTCAPNQHTLSGSHLGHPIEIGEVDAGRVAGDLSPLDRGALVFCFWS